MIEEWRKERAQLDRQIVAVRQRIVELKGNLRQASVRFDLRKLLNVLCVRRHAFHQRVLKYETEQELTQIAKSISGLSDDDLQKLMKDMERIRQAPVSPITG